MAARRVVYTGDTPPIGLTSSKEFVMASTRMLEMISSLHQEARTRGLFFQSNSLPGSDGRTISIGSKQAVWFGSCSYLGLDREPALIEAAVDATRAFGTQFASSRGYISLGLHTELEAKLGQMFDAHALLGQTTTLAHQAAFDVLATERDAVILDHQVHVSVQNAATLARAHGAHVESVHHERLEEAMDRLKALSTKYDRVWFATDGVTSMYGDLAPVELMRQMLDVAPNVHLYVDDAHGTGWAGVHGRGLFLEQHGWSDRLVVATSLSKVPAAGGAALLMRNAELKEKIRTCGGTMVFSGPLQPPLLGAAMAAADFFLSDQLPGRQQALFDRIRLFKRGLLERGLPVLANNDAPVVFVPTGLPAVSFDLAEKLLDAGYYVNVAMFPAVPMRRSGLRITLTPHLRMEDINGLLNTLERIYPAALAHHGVVLSELLQDFSRAVIGAQRPRVGTPAKPSASPTHPVQTWPTIAEVPVGIWDPRLGGVGCISRASLTLQENVFVGPEPEHDWGFWYAAAGTDPTRPAALSVFTEQLTKNDMIESGALSEELERLRETNPYHHTSRVLVTGGGLSEGTHLWLDRTQDWKPALRGLVRAAIDRYKERDLDEIILRDLPEDDEVATVLIGEGFIKVTMPNRHHVDTRLPSFLVGHSTRTRKYMREMLARAEQFELRVLSPSETSNMAEHLHTLHSAVVNRSRTLNMFPLPQRLWSELARNAAWEVVGLFSSDTSIGHNTDLPLAWFGGHCYGEDYAALMCGLDYRFVYSHGVYRQLLIGILKRAHHRGADIVHLGMTAEQEKRRVGSTAEPVSAWVLGRDTFAASQLREMEERILLTPNG